MSRPVLLLPLDDRPCNRLFPGELARLAGRRVLTPPRPLLGRFLRPGRPERLAAWLVEHAGQAAGLVVSADMLCYGGLVASRTPTAAASEARRRLHLLAQLRRRHPGLPILAWGVIMRLGTTVSSPAAQELHHRLVEYSQLSDQVHRLGQASLAGKLRELERATGRPALDAYRAVRRRNHALNLALVRLAARGAVDCAVLSQEDCTPVGLHRAEQQALAAEIAAAGLGDRVLIYPGADEVGCVLLARLLAPGRRVHPIYASPQGARVVARYEDRPLADTVASQVAGAGALLAPAGPADLYLGVNTPRGEQQEAQQADRHDPQAAGLSPFLQRLADLVAAGQAVAVADAAYANGADPALVRSLAERGLTGRLAGYAGWNTAGNTIGTALAQGLLCTAGEVGRHARRALALASFTCERLVDDYAYQVCVRPQVYRLAAARGHSPLRLGGAWREYEQVVRELLAAQAQELYRQHFQGRPLPGGWRVERLEALRVRLPWPRLFEVEVQARLGLA